MKCLWQMTVIVCSTILVLGCGSDSGTYSILADGDNFIQSDPDVSTKIDILWVIDNSGSMATSQQNLSDNFDSFINSFVDRNFDFQMAITTSDSYRAHDDYIGKSHYDPNKSLFHGGVLKHTMPGLVTLFQSNILVGDTGHWDERVHQSFGASLSDTRNEQLVREDSFLAVIMVSDEEDYSWNGDNGVNWDGTEWLESVIALGEPGAMTLAHGADVYDDLLSDVTDNAGAKGYSVSTISILDQDCMDLLNNPGDTFRKIGTRMHELSTLTGGTDSSLCEPFNDTLSSIADTIAQKATEFFLSRQPLVETIVVTVNGSVVPNHDPPSNNNGWSYKASTNSVLFHNSSIPSQGDEININFDPESLDF